MRVGVIGGGQLAWMMAAGAHKLGIDLVVQTPSATDPAVAIAADTIFAAVDDAAATAQMATQCDVITFENEFVNLDALNHLAQQGVNFYPQLFALRPLLDKFEQRCFLRDRGLPTPRFAALTDRADVAQLSQFGFPAVLKARRLGYDGRGTVIVRDLPHLQALLASDGTSDASEQWLASNQWLLEEFVPFQRELAVMVARSLSGEVVVYPVVETQQVNQVCQRVFVTQEMPSAVGQQVEAIATTLLNQLSYVGVMGIEFFLTPEGKVLVNETAPRTHNSGHYSLDACETSQFEQQLRCVCQLPLGSSALTCAGALMVNLLGFESAESEYLDKRAQIAAIPRSHLYWYGKSVARPGRKLGHVTVQLVAGEGEAEAKAIATAIEQIWYG